MREAQTKKIPLTLILGDNEVKDNLVSYRKFGNQETTTLSKEEFVKVVLEAIKDKKNNL